MISSEFLHPDFDYDLAIFSPKGELLTYVGNTEFWKEVPIVFPNVIADVLIDTGSNATCSPPIILPTQEDPLVFVVSAKDNKGPIAVGAFSPVTFARHTLAGAFSPGGDSTAFIVGQNTQIMEN